MILDVGHGVLGLRVGIIPFPDLGVFAPFIEEAGLIVVVRALEHLPVVKALAALRRYVGRAPGPVDMPLADVTGIVARSAHGLGNGGCFVVQAQIIQEEAMRERILTCEQAASVRAAYRNSRDRIGKVHALLSEGVNIRGAHFLIAHVSVVHRAPLIGKEVENVRPRAGGAASCLIGSGNSSGGAAG